MNTKLKHCLEFIGIAAITFVIALSSALNPWTVDSTTAIQKEILDYALQVRNGFLAYVEIEGGHYGPVLYEFFGLGYLPMETHEVQFAMECIMLFFTVLFTYKTAKLFTSPIFAFISAAFLTVFEWGALTHAGAEELMFFILSLSCYHIARLLKYGFLSHHAYLLAIDLGLVFFLQPGYVFIWGIMILFFAIKFIIDGLKGKGYLAFWLSTLEGFATVGVPMGLYLWYFKNAKDFWQQVVVYNMNNLGGLADGLRIIWGTPWIVLAGVLIVVTVIKALMGENVMTYICWFGFMIVVFVVIALQGDNLDSYLQLSKAVYIVPMAGAFSLLDKPLGLKIEERKY